MGYLVAFISQFAGATFLVSVFTQFLYFFIGSLWLFVIIATDITKDAIAFNIEVKTPDVNPVKLTKRFSDMVQIYSNAKE